MKTKLIFCLFGLILFISCEPEVLDNERWIVQGKIIDSIGNPIEDIKVTSSVGTYQLGEGFTDEKGNFKFSTLGTDRSRLEITVNSGLHHQDSDHQKAWSSSMLRIEGKDNFKPDFDLGSIQLSSAATLNLKIEANSSSSGNLRFSLQYPSKVYHEIISLENSDMGFGSDHSYSKTINAADSPFEKEFFSLLNSEIILIYSINNGGETQVTIPLNETENDYTLSY